MNPSLRPGTKRDLPAAAALFGAAFEATPQWRWMIEDDDARHAVLPALLRSTLAQGLARGRLVVADDDGVLAGVACWMAPGKWRVPTWRGATSVRDVIPHVRSGALLGFIERGRIVDGAAKAAHPAEPHWYLGGVAVAPSEQGRGLGTRLIREGLGHTGQLPVYLECEEGLTRYYETFGFRTRHRIDPGGGAPAQVGMWLEPDFRT